MNVRRAALPALVLMALGVLPMTAASPGFSAAIEPRDLREWLSYIASDDLQGRATFGTGIGLAASYIEEHLRAWGVKPAGGSGSYLQTVRVLGVRTTSRSKVTVQVGDQTRTFTDRDGVSFPRNAGGKQRLVLDRVEFTGYGLDFPAIGHEDYRGKNVTGAAVVWLGATGPMRMDPASGRLLLNGRPRYAVDEMHAAASIGAPRVTGEPERGRLEPVAGDAPRSEAGGNSAMAADFTTAQRFDVPIPPNVTGTDAFFEFLFSRAPVNYAELKRLADARAALPSFALEGVTLTFDVDADYEVVRTRLAQNVIGVVDGTDAQLKSSYVAFGAHYDHVGYAEGEIAAAQRRQRPGLPGRVTPGFESDRIWNGADDDGSGTVALMALARSFAAGPRPKRSLLFVWHAGEENGRWGSLYFADHPTVDLDRVVAQLNLDMVGRNRENRASEAGTVYLVGSDRISTELDTIIRAANDGQQKPLRLDYEFNDPSDLEQIYYRSDHYSYASKGIPVTFFTTGLHPDYHTNTDEVSKIEFEKLARITALVHAVGSRLGNLDRAPARDHKGARMGRTMTALTPQDHP